MHQVSTAAALVAALLPALVHAQVPGITEGLEQPVTSAAVVEGPTSAVVNPASAGLQRGLELRYLHTEGEVGSVAPDAGNGLYLGIGTGHGLGASVAVEWLPSVQASGDMDRRTSWALSFGGRTVAAGGAVRFYEGATPGVDSLVSADLGLTFRPVPLLSVGAVVRDVTEPTFQSTLLPRRYVLAVGTRPAGDWLTIGVDTELLQRELAGRAAWLEGARVGALAQAEIVGGVALQGRVDSIPGSDELSGQLGLVVRVLNVGVSTSAVQSRGGGTGVLAAASVRTQPGTAIDPRPQPRVALIDLDHELARLSGLQSVLESRNPMLSTIVGLEGLARDPSIQAAVIRMGSLPDQGFGAAYELRQAILDVRARGKKVAVLLSGAGDAEYYVASAADEIWSTREAAFLVNGVAARTVFLADALGKIGIQFEAVRIGAYKNAPDQLVRSDVAPEHAEVVESILDSAFERYVTDVASARRMDPAAYRQILEAGILTASRARELGLVDELLYPDELSRVAARFAGGDAEVFDANLRARRWTRWGAPPVIAVVPVEGVITTGRSGRGPFGMMDTVGAETVRDALESAAADSTVHAIVLRIDSPGGDAQASDLIFRAVQKAREKKPVIASMGDKATSGGYYAAAGAHRIFAAPTTLTGSIGVFALKPSVRKLLDLVGAGTWKASRGSNAEILGVIDPWTDAEKAAVREYVSSAYSSFLQAVATGRPLTAEEVDHVAQGRVWTGAQARDLRLVDDLGGLSGALASAATAAGLDGDVPIEYRLYQWSPGLLEAALMSPAAALPAPLMSLVRAGLPRELLLDGIAPVWALEAYEISLE